MRSARPYLLRAFHAWISDNGLTPYIVVDASAEGVDVPAQAVQDGRVILNVGFEAVRDLGLENDAVSFSARFGGVARSVYVPVHAVLAIYARENGRGMVFKEEEDRDPPPPDGEVPATGPTRPSLRIVK